MSESYIKLDILASWLARCEGWLEESKNSQVNAGSIRNRAVEVKVSCSMRGPQQTQFYSTISANLQ